MPQGNFLLFLVLAHACFNFSGGQGGGGGGGDTSSSPVNGVINLEVIYLKV